MRSARFFPQSGRRLVHRHVRRLQLRSVAGSLELELSYGQDPSDGHWGYPSLERWGLCPHQKLTPSAREKLCFTAAATGSYEDAAEVACKWGLEADDSTIHRLVQEAGARAEKQVVDRLKKPPELAQPRRAPNPLANLMIDGCQIRFRGVGWGLRKTEQERVEWHELKIGVYFTETPLRRAGKRKILTEKRVVNWQGEGLELARRLHWEAQRGGLAVAQRVRCVNDGAPWIWNLVQDRWPKAEQVLDFYHASEHLGSLAAATQSNETAAQDWVRIQRHDLRHGREDQVLRKIAALSPRRGDKGKLIKREQNYFASQAHRMHYKSLAKTGPIGSGAVESACRKRQCRFKRCGQFWTPTGLRNLCALDEARHNRHWHQLWFSS